MDRHEIILTIKYLSYEDWANDGDGEIKFNVEFRKGYSGTKELSLTAEEFEAVEFALDVDKLKYNDPTPDAPFEVMVLSFPGEDAGDYLEAALQRENHPCAAAVLAKM